MRDGILGRETETKGEKIRETDGETQAEGEHRRNQIQKWRQRKTDRDR